MRSVLILISMAILIALAGCTGGRLTEEEYLTQAKLMLDQGNIEDAIYNYKNLVEYYPMSEQIGEYRSQLLDLTLRAAEKHAGTSKEDVYIAEAMAIAKSSGDTLAGYWVKYRIAERTSLTDAEKGKALFAEIPIDGLYFAAQMALGKGDYAGANRGYEKILELYPDDPGNYKAIFLMGFNYSEYMKDFVKAKLYFDRVLAEYPDCDLAPSAKWMLENMGKSPDEIKFIEEKDQA